MSTSGNSSNETVPCSNTGCHFWGRANTNNYCSKCFKELDGDASTAAAALSGSASVSSIMNNKSSKADSASSTSPRSSSSKSSSSHRSSLSRPSSSSKTSDTLVAAATSEAKSDSSSAAAASPDVDAAAAVVAATAAGGADGDEEVPTKAVQKNKKRCWECKKKVGYTGIECRCGFIYCGTHRYPDSHKCEFDYKEFGRGVLAKNNEKLENEKLGDRL